LKAPRQLLFQFRQSFPPLGNHVWRHRVTQLRRWSALPRTEREDVYFGEADLPSHPASGFKVGIRLTWKTKDDVSRESGCVESFANPATPFQEARAAITPLHQGKDPI